MRAMNIRIRPSIVIAAVLAFFVAFAIYVYFLYPADEMWDWVPIITFAAPFWIPLAILMWFLRRRYSQNRRASIVLTYVEEAIRLNMPLSPMMLAAANSESGAVRRRLLSLHNRLERGEALAYALECSVPEISSSTAIAVGAADQIGRLPQFLRRLVRRLTPDEPFADGMTGFYRAYGVIMVLFILTVVCGGIFICVMPKFQAIFHDFHIQLPWLTQLFIEISRSYWPFLAVGALLVVMCIPLRGPLRDYLAWWLPVIGATERDHGMAELCDFLVDSLEAGQPMDAIVLRAAEAQSNAVLRHRVQDWGSRLVTGQPLAAAARAAAMPSLLSGMLQTVRGDEDLLQVLSFLGRHYEDRFSRTREFLRSAAIPAFVFSMGAIVLLVELSVFQPLIGLIQATAHYPGGF
jgi:type IV pilus assembly protein PilC